MIIVRLKGGLGNQMFQYAAALTLAKYHQVPLEIDIDWFSSDHQDTNREYSLDCFNLSSSLNSSKKKDYSRYFGGRSATIYRLIETLKPFRLKKFYQESKEGYDKNFFQLSSHIFLIGYFQDYRYFDVISKDIRKEFSFKQDYVKRIDEELKEKISQSNSVSIHIRRGDYVNNPQIREKYYNCPLEYYQHCINWWQNKMEQPIFFVFSDDIAWAKDNLKINSESYFMKDSAKAWEDLYLMSHCKNNIIANSTFSWWAAWLNDNPDKIVMAPKKWFNDSQKNSIFLPDNWLRF